MKRWASFTAALAGMLALSGLAGIPRAQASGDLVYTVHPVTKFGFKSGAVTRPRLDQGVCVATFGLNCYGPQDIRTAYSWPDNLTGAGQTIVIVDAFGSPTVAQDLHVYDQFWGLSDPTLNVIYPGGKPTFNVKDADQVSWASETSLDVQMAHGLAPGATIDLVIAANDHGNVLNNAVRYAIDHHLGNVISMSYGIPEGVLHGNNGQIAQSHSNFEAAKAAGITLIAASGDLGATNGVSSTPNADYPASDPLVTGVGGTDLFTNPDGSYSHETVWNDGDPALCPYGCAFGPFGATNGGVSDLFAAPAYQQPFTHNTQRETVDVAFNAGVYTGVLIYLGFYPASSGQNGFYFFGGDSEGAPSWSAIVAMTDQASGHSIGDLNPKLYSIASNPARYAADFHDVTVGNNAFNGPGYSAGPGYDMPTGLGTPKAASLIGDLLSF